MNDVENVISQLEKQQSAIDRAISALREITGSPATGPEHSAGLPKLVARWEVHLL